MSIVDGFYLKCSVCGGKFELKNNLNTCPKCGGPFWFETEDSYLEKNSSCITSPARDMWNYCPLFPLSRKEDTINLGEGGTPIIRGRSLPKMSGYDHIIFKDETRNPTGSFKDRQTSLYCNYARQEGYTGIVTMSSGNVAASLACHAAANGLKSYELLPAWTPMEKIQMITAYGGFPIKVETTSSSELYNMVEEISSKFKLYNGITAAVYSALNIHGSKTISYELYPYLSDVSNIFIASGGGGGITAIYHGLKDMLKLGLIDAVPKLYAVQAEECDPIYRAWKGNLGYDEIRKSKCTNCRSVATPLADDIPLDGFSAVKAVKETKGQVIIVSDDEIINTQQMLAQNTGIFAEPAGAAGFAGLIKTRMMGITDKSEESIVIITGNGIKNLDSLRLWSANQNLEDPNLEDINKMLKKYSK
jgi:threonine synthase